MTTSPEERLFPPSTLRSRLASIEAAAVAGIVCAAGWSLSLRGLLATPDLGATDREITRFYSDPSNGTAALVWVQVLVLSTIAFLWFVGVVRGRVGDREPKLFGTVFLGSAVLLAGLMFLGATLLAAPGVLVALTDTAPDPGAVSLLRAAAAVVLSVFLPRVATLVMFSTASLGRVTGGLPRWLVWVTFAIGLFELVNVTVSTPTVFLVPAWIALVSVVLLVRHPADAFALGTPPAEG
ncbi:MAG: hypothetical protein ACOYOP_12775 [Microthrixaceae bacterium]